MAGVRWSKEEIDTLIKNYPELGAETCSQQLIDRTVVSVRRKATELGLKRSCKWTKAEVDFLLKNYFGFGPSYCSKELNKSYKAIVDKAAALGIKSSNWWSEQDIEYLIREYSVLGPLKCSQKLNRSYKAILDKANLLGLKAPNKWDYLTDEDLIDLVKKHKLYYLFSINSELPDPKVLLRRFGTTSWRDILTLAGLTNNGSRPFDPTTFYILKFVDTDNTIFYKYGYTQNDVTVRYRGRKDFDIVHLHECSLEEAIMMEKELGKEVEKYSPIDSRFYNGHAGYTECFIAKEEII